MGMDAYLYRVHNRREVENDNFFEKCITLNNSDAWEQDEFKSSAELWYGRKFWDLHHAVFGHNYENGTYVEVTKEMLEKMLIFAAKNTDYFGGFNTVEALCWAYHYYDEMIEHGFILLYECDW